MAASLHIVLTTKHLARFKQLQTNSEKIEYNGEIKIDETSGAILGVTERRGQYVEPCTKGCIINWHTHPQDYSAYYPDHPSAQDMKYVLFAVSKTRELIAHMVFTPCYVYILTLSGKLLDVKPSEFDVYSAEIDRVFKAASAAHSDRATDEFRKAWLEGLRGMGFVIDRHTGYDSPITMHLRRIDSSAIRMMEADAQKKRTAAATLRQPGVGQKIGILLCMCVLFVWLVVHKG